MPPVLFEKIDANIIISDLSPTVVREWKKLFEKEFKAPNVYYAALDNCDIPFEDNSIDVISAGGGFGNTEGDKFKALTEIYRVLKPGGLYVSGDGFVTKETLKSLPENARKVLLEKRPDIFEDFYDASVTAGFKTIDNIITGGWNTKDDESLIADLANELGINIYFTSYLRYCIK
jgi:ubiquinone/menaquinone biosynthesis C-methylase UbiE